MSTTGINAVKPQGHKFCPTAVLLKDPPTNNGHRARGRDLACIPGLDERATHTSRRRRRRPSTGQRAGRAARCEDGTDGCDVADIGERSDGAPT
jgi:hypothetical protein